MTKSMIRNVSLTNLIEQYVSARNEERAIGRELSEKTIVGYVESAKAFSAFLERPAIAADLTAKALNRFVAAKLQSGDSPYGVRNRRTHLKALRRFAIESGLVKNDGRLRAVYCPPLAVEGYDLETMAVLCTYLESQVGVVRRTGIPKSLWWSSFVRAKWDAGARPSDMVRIEPKHFDPKGWIWLTQRKTGKAGWRRLNESTRQAVIACVAAAPDREFIWPGYRVRRLYSAFVKLAERAGIGGRLQFIRRGVGSEFEYRNPGQAWRFLRHSDPRVFDKFYRIERITDFNSPIPPEIGSNEATAELFHRTIVRKAPQILTTQKRIDAAQAVWARWQLFERLTGAEVEAAAEELDVTQTQLAKHVGLSLDWVNAMLRGRKPIGKDSELRFREFVRELADGRTPMPLGKEAFAPAELASVPITDEAREALSSDPMQKSDLAAIAGWLAAYGITGRTLADAMGVKFKFYQNLRYGDKKIPADRAAALRSAFGVAAA